MSEPKYVEFRPRWMRQRTDADRVLDETPVTGSLAEVSPRINARLLPIGGSHTVSARTLSIEFSSFDALGQPRAALRVDKEYIGRVNKVRESRRATQATLETLEGQVTALDIREGMLQLSIDGQKRRVAGHFTMMFLSPLLESLGRRVRLRGLVAWRKNAPVSIQVEDAELLGDDQ